MNESRDVGKGKPSARIYGNQWPELLQGEEIYLCSSCMQIKQREGERCKAEERRRRRRRGQEDFSQGREMVKKIMGMWRVE